MPDEAQLLPGDLLLVSALKPSSGSAAIINAQAGGGHAAIHARFHHAATYIGDNLVCEAQLWKGVQVVSLYEYVGTHLLRFRRDPNLSQDDRWRLAVRSLHQLRKPYGVFALPRLWYESRRGFWRPGVLRLTLRGIICSSLYAEAYAWTTGRLLVEGQLNLTTPADLSLSARLSEANVEWLKIVETPL